MSLPKLTSRIYFPMLVSNHGTADLEAAGVNEGEWVKLRNLSPEKNQVLLSEELPYKLKNLQEVFHVDDLILGNISLSVRKLFFGELRIATFESNIRSMLEAKGGDASQSKAISDFIQNEILTIKPKPKVEETIESEQKSQAVTVKLPLLQALSKYEQLGNQLITQERIKIKSQTEPVRPSLLYWIKYYRDELGIGHHDSVQRGNFLFRSENGKHLSGEERERVNLVLKSVEENIPMDIDTDHSEIIFPAFEAPTRPAPVRPVTSVAQPFRVENNPNGSNNPALSFGHSAMTQASVSKEASQTGTLSFTSKHVFPAEKTPEGAVPERRIPVPVPKANPFRIRPVSLGKEE